MGGAYSLPEGEPDEDSGMNRIDLPGGGEAWVLEDGERDQLLAKNSSPFVKFVKMLEAIQLTRLSLIESADEDSQVGYTEDVDVDHHSDEEITVTDSDLASLAASLEDGNIFNSSTSLTEVITEEVVQQPSDSMRSRKKTDSKTIEAVQQEESSRDWEEGWSLIKYPELLEFYTMYLGFRAADMFVINKVKQMEMRKNGEFINALPSDKEPRDVKGLYNWIKDNFNDMMEYGTHLESITDQMDELCEKIEGRYSVISDDKKAELESVAVSDSSAEPGPVPGDNVIDPTEVEIYQQSKLLRTRISAVRNLQKKFIDTTEESLRGRGNPTRT